MIGRQQLDLEVLHVGLGVAFRVVAGDREFHGTSVDRSLQRPLQPGSGTQNPQQPDADGRAGRRPTATSRTRRSAGGLA